MSTTIAPPGGFPSSTLPLTEPISAPAPTRRLRLSMPAVGKHRRPGPALEGLTGRQGRRVAQPTLEALLADVGAPALAQGQW